MPRQRPSGPTRADDIADLRLDDDVVPVLGMIVGMLADLAPAD